jgi:hypothetical protein
MAVTSCVLATEYRWIGIGSVQPLGATSNGLTLQNRACRAKATGTSDPLETRRGRRLGTNIGITKNEPKFTSRSGQ